MAAVLRKRKIIDTGFGDASLVAQRQPRILHFGRLSKPGIRRLDKETKTAKTTAATAAIHALNTEIETPNENEPKKRKLEHDEETTPTSTSTSSQTRPVTPPPPAAAATADNATTTKTTTQRKTRLPPSQPGETRRIAPLKKSKTTKKRGGLTVAESPTQGARAILEAFVFATPVAEISASAKDIAEEKTDEGRNGSQELVALHAAFLNALSLHYAHEGTSTPADLQQLATSITRIWGRRRVTTEDIRRVLGVQQWKSPQKNLTVEEADRHLPALLVSDFGKGRICVEFEAAESHGAHASPLPVPALKRIFASNLLALGERELPLAPIVPYTSLCSTSSTGMGAARLADLKASAVNAQANTARSEGLDITHKGRGLLSGTTPSTTATATATAAAIVKPASRGASLLERICAKEAHAARQPAAPTAAALARKAALQRLEEIIPVIEILARRNSINSISSSNSNGGNNSKVSAASSDLAAALGLTPRNSSSTNIKMTTVSFTMPALVQHLQQSLRHPLAKDEGELCIRLLATDVLPRWVQLHTLHGRWTSVAVRGAVSRAEWMPKLKSLLEEE